MSGNGSDLRRLGVTAPQARFIRFLRDEIEPQEARAALLPTAFQVNVDIIGYWPDGMHVINVGRALIRRGLVGHDMKRGRIRQFPWFLTESGRVVASLLPAESPA